MSMQPLGLLDEFFLQAMPLPPEPPETPGEDIRLNARAIQHEGDNDGSAQPPMDVVNANLPYWANPGRGANGESAT